MPRSQNPSSARSEHASYQIIDATDIATLSILEVPHDRLQFLPPQSKVVSNNTCRSRSRRRQTGSNVRHHLPAAYEQRLIGSPNASVWREQDATHPGAIGFNESLGATATFRGERSLHFGDEILNSRVVEQSDPSKDLGNRISGLSQATVELQRPNAALDLTDDHIDPVVWSTHALIRWHKTVGLTMLRKPDREDIDFALVAGVGVIRVNDQSCREVAVQPQV